jgi:hypothetical protein
MRAQGLEKEAAEVEMNYLNYKRAQTLYETSKEKGEDQIHAAHPDGSHKLEGMDTDEATFEDILDQHAKIIQVMDKKPSGKLSSAVQVLNSVKKVLGQKNLDAIIASKINEVKQHWAQVDKIIKEEGGLSYVPEIGRGIEYSTLSYGISKSLNREMSMERIKWLKDQINNIFSLIQPGVTGGVSVDAWEQLANDKKELLTSLEVAYEFIQEKHAITTRQRKGQPNPEETVVTPGSQTGGSQTDGRLATLIRNLDYYKAIAPTRLAPKYVLQADGYIANYRAQVVALQTRLKGSSEQEATAAESEIKQLEGWINGWATGWKLK